MITRGDNVIDTEAQRVREIRKTLNLSQEVFGSKLGVGKTAISKIEKNERSLTEQMAKAICREYNVNYIWLTEGIGDMFMGVPETIIDELVIQYDLNDIETEILRNYLTLTKEQRQIVQEYLRKIFNLDKGK